MALVAHRFRHRTAEPLAEIVSEIGATGLVLELGSAGEPVVDILVDDAFTGDLTESMDKRGWSLVEVAPSTYREREAQARLGLGVTQPGQTPFAASTVGLVLAVPVVSGDGFGIVTDDGFGVVTT